MANFTYLMIMSVSLKAIEATVDESGRIITQSPNIIKWPAKVVLTVAVEEDEDLALASEDAWAGDWNNSTEDEAWANLQEAK